MTRFLYANGIRIFDCPEFAMQLRDRVREAAAALASEAGVTIEHIAKGHVRKEEVVARVLARRGDHPGPVHVISAMEACNGYRPRRDKASGRGSVRPDSGKCLHYYFCFMDAELGLACLRVPTWSPFRPQFYCNGHSWPARQMTAEGTGCAMAGNAFARIEGTCIEHRFGDASVKMYGKSGTVLRIETTTNGVSFFKHHRKVEHRDGPPTREMAPAKKGIYSRIDLREVWLGCNKRYLAHLSALDDFSAGARALDRLTKPRKVADRTVKGINFFGPGDTALLHALQNPRANIAGARRADLLPDLGMFAPDRLSRQLRRLRDLGVIKRVTGTCRYCLTKAGRAATAAAERLTAATIIPALA